MMATFIIGFFSGIIAEFVVLAIVALHRKDK